MDVVRKALVVRGSTGQIRANPLADLALRLDASIVRLENELGVTPAARGRMGIRISAPETPRVAESNSAGEPIRASQGGERMTVAVAPSMRSRPPRRGWRGPRYEGELPTLGYGVLELDDELPAEPARRDAAVRSRPTSRRSGSSSGTRCTRSPASRSTAAGSSSGRRAGARARWPARSRRPSWARAASADSAPVVFDGWDADGEPVGAAVGHGRAAAGLGADRGRVRGPDRQHVLRALPDAHREQPPRRDRARHRRRPDAPLPARPPGQARAGHGVAPGRARGSR